jgi:hypothetical protein
MLLARATKYGARNNGLSEDSDKPLFLRHMATTVADLRGPEW